MQIVASVYRDPFVSIPNFVDLDFSFFTIPSQGLMMYHITKKNIMNQKFTTI